MMNFDQMMEAWKAQDDKPLYGVDRDLLQLVLRHEQAYIRRALRWDLWANYLVGILMSGAAGVFLVALLFYRGAPLQTIVLAGSCVLAAVLLWLGSLSLSRRRQAVRERDFGNTLHDEIRRNLSLFDYQLSQIARWVNLMLWSAPMIASASLISWLIMEINGEGNSWLNVAMVVFLFVSIASTTYDSTRRARRELLPRRQRLSDLLSMLNACQ